jgi:hypothetical protein
MVFFCLPKLIKYNPTEVELNVIKLRRRTNSLTRQVLFLN